MLIGGMSSPSGTQPTPRPGHGNLAPQATRRSLLRQASLAVSAVFGPACRHRAASQEAASRGLRGGTCEMVQETGVGLATSCNTFLAQNAVNPATKDAYRRAVFV